MKCVQIRIEDEAAVVDRINHLCQNFIGRHNFQHFIDRTKDDSVRPHTFSN